MTNTRSDNTCTGVLSPLPAEGLAGSISKKKRRVGWNKTKSKKLLEFYGFDLSDSESDDDEKTPSCTNSWNHTRKWSCKFE